MGVCQKMTQDNKGGGGGVRNGPKKNDVIYEQVFHLVSFSLLVLTNSAIQINLIFLHSAECNYWGTFNSTNLLDSLL